MDGERWWVVDEIARWWRTASQEARYMLMQRAAEGTKECSLKEVQIAAAKAEIDCGEHDASEEAARVVEAWSTCQRVRRR